MEAAATWEAIDSLTPWDKNPRKNDHAVQAVADSIRRFGFGQPIIARAADRVVIGGHTRLKAAQKLGLDKVPVRFLDLDPAEAAALALADNKLGELAEWDEEAVAEILGELEQQGTPIDGLGWDDDELKALLGDGIEAAPPSDEAPEVDEEGEPDSMAGTLYQLGPHRLVCGDSTKPETWSSLLGDERAQMVWTDPPYGMALDVRYERMHKARRKTDTRFRPVEGDSKPFDASSVIDIASDVLEQFWWGADYYRSHLPDGGSWVVWDKRANESGMDLDKVIGGMFELCWSKVQHRREIARILWSGHHGMQGADSGARVHPTQKPIALAAWFFERWGKPGDIVVDLFAGSGTTLMACAQTGRVARVIELDPRYCDVIRRRWTMWATANGIDPGPGALAPREVPDGD